MSKLLILIIALSILCGCSDGMSRKEVIEAYKECKDAGLKPVRVVNGLTLETMRVECIFNEDKETNR